MFYGIDKRVGKSVWLFEKKENGWDETLNKGKVWLVESLHEPDETHYDFYFVVSDGNEKREVFWHDTVVVPGNEEDEVLRVMNYLTSNGFYFSEVWDEDIIDTPTIRIAIHWGDWKHDHGWCDSLMEHIGYEAFNEIVTEEDGSDTYSSEHIFIRKDAPGLERLHALQKLFSE